MSTLPSTRPVRSLAGNGDNGGRVSPPASNLVTLNSGVRQTQPAGVIRTLVAMPAYNEESAIAKTILGAQQHADKVLVVDDGSKDETTRIAGALGAIVIRHEVNRGYGGALQTIFSTAREMGVEELVIIDADGQHNPGEIPAPVSSTPRSGSSRDGWFTLYRPLQRSLKTWSAGPGIHPPQTP